MVQFVFSAGLVLGFGAVWLAAAILLVGYFRAQRRDMEERMKDKEARLAEMEKQLKEMEERTEKEMEERTEENRSYQPAPLPPPPPEAASEAVPRSEEDVRRWKQERLQRIREKYASSRRTSLRRGGHKGSGEEVTAAETEEPEEAEAETECLQEELRRERRRAEEKTREQEALAELWEKERLRLVRENEALAQKFVSLEQKMAAAAAQEVEQRPLDKLKVLKA